MRILDRYILKPVITTFLGCLLVFISLYVISDILGHLDEIIKNHAGIVLLYEYYRTCLPKIFSETSPIAILLATIYTFGKLNRTNELIAMRSSGLSLWDITFPVLVIGLILSIAIFFTNEKLGTQAQADAEKLKSRIENKDSLNPKLQIINNLTFYGLGNRLYFVNSFDAKNARMEGISILGYDKQQNLTFKIVAKEGLYKNNVWTFYEYTRYNFDPYGQIVGDAIFNSEQVMDIIESPQDFLLQRKRPELMNIRQLEDYIWRLKRSGATAVLRNLLVELYQRYAMPFSCLVLILIGIPFSFISHRRANIFSSFGICLLISFLYYILNAISINLGRNGTIFPWLSAWLAPVVFSAAAINKISKSY